MIVAAAGASLPRHSELMKFALALGMAWQHAEAKDLFKRHVNKSHSLNETCYNGHRVAGSGCTCQIPYSLIHTSEGRGCGIQHCGAGNFSFDTKSCVCKDGWRKAGITNPINMAMTRCTQYQCQSDMLCAELLELPFATCPIVGWNCDCGIWAASHSAGGAKCMHTWWALASKATRFILFLSRSLWMAVAAIGVVLLPFGKNTLGTTGSYSWTVLQDDLAWSIFVVKLGIWFYAFAVTTYACLALMWFSIFVLVLIVAMMCMCVAACFAAMCALGGEAAPASCEGLSLEGCVGAEGCCSLECAQCGQCCEACFCYGSNSAVAETPASLYIGDSCFWYCHLQSYSTPHTDDCRCTCCGNCCSCLPRCRRCRAIFFGVPCYRFLTAVFPRVPENMLGGVSGWIVGTHPLKNRYDPESRIVQILASPCWSLANRSEHWRRHVYLWLHERDAGEATAQAGVSIAEARRADEHGASSVIIYGDVHVDPQQGVFTEAERIFNYDDYKANQCWICQEAADTWDMWFACRHVFCQRCSGEMLRRRMPCPLCRVRSSHVVRRKALVMESEMEALEGEQLLHRRSRMRGAAAAQSSMQGGPCPQQVPPSQGSMDLGDP